jgi:Skp family chaperone for outer membrane proteins
VKFSILIALLASLSPAIHADTYKWVNEEGVVTYSQSPPPEQEAERVKLPGTTSTSERQNSQTRLKQLRQRLADSAEDRKLTKQQKQEAKQEQERKRHNCEAARSNLSKLEGLGNRLYKTGGEHRRLTEEERQSLMQKEREHIRDNCGK